MQNSGIESLVEELCSKLKDIQNKQKGLADCQICNFLIKKEEKNTKKFTNKCSKKISSCAMFFTEEKQIQKKSDGSQSPERAESPSSKDQVEM